MRSGGCGIGQDAEGDSGIAAVHEVKEIVDEFVAPAFGGLRFEPGFGGAVEKNGSSAGTACSSTVVVVPSRWSDTPVRSASSGISTASVKIVSRLGAVLGMSRLRSVNHAVS